jgi:hypothetical protein
MICVDWTLRARLSRPSAFPFHVCTRSARRRTIATRVTAPASTYATRSQVPAPRPPVRRIRQSAVTRLVKPVIVRPPAGRLILLKLAISVRALRACKIRRFAARNMQVVRRATVLASIHATRFRAHALWFCVRRIRQSVVMRLVKSVIVRPPTGRLTLLKLTSSHVQALHVCKIRRSAARNIQAALRAIVSAVLRVTSLREGVLILFVILIRQNVVLLCLRQLCRQAPAH